MQGKSRDCLKLTSEKTGIGLRRENFEIPDIQKVETSILVILGPKRQKSIDFLLFFRLFSKYLVPSGAKYREKGVGRYKNWRGVIDTPILELLTFGSNPDFGGFGVFCACFACFAHVFGIFLVPREAALAADLITA